MDAKRGLLPVVATGVLVMGGGFVLAGPAGAATVPVTGSISSVATDDSYTSSTRRQENFGTDPKLVVGTSHGETRVSYVKFTTAALPPGVTVTGAELRLPLDSTPVATPLSLYPAGTAWTEATLNAANAPALSAQAGSVTPATSDSTVRFDVSKLVTKAGTYAFALKSASTTAATRFRAMEFGDVRTGGPELQLTYTVKPPECVTNAMLVPSCGVLWGAAAGGFTSTPRDTALKSWEDLTGRTATIFHAYHKGDELFPTAAEIAMTQDPAKPRVLLLNWKVDYGTTWAKVAAGEKDARIDRWADYVKSTYGTRKFFLVLHHEPANDVVATAGSGMTALDYKAMYRHVVERLRADGVTNAVNVMAYMGNEKWMAQSWWPDLYPGDDVVDWIGLDSYVSVEKDYYHYGDMGDILDRQPAGGGLGFYTWATTQHPSKPFMLAEWGMYHRVKVPTDKSAAYAGVLPQLKSHPLVKAIVYFDTASDDEGDRDISVNSLPGSLTAFRTLAADPIFTVRIGS